MQIMTEEEGLNYHWDIFDITKVWPDAEVLPIKIGKLVLDRKVMTDMDRDHRVGNIVDHLNGAQKRIQLRQTALFYKADPEYGQRVAEGLGLKMSDVEGLAAMSDDERAKATEEGA